MGRVDFKWLIDHYLEEPKSEEQYKSRLEEIKREKEHKKMLIAQTIPVEKKLRRELENGLTTLREEEAFVKRRLESNSNPALQGYRRIDMSAPLRWRNEDNHPVLAVFHSDSPINFIGLPNEDSGLSFWQNWHVNKMGDPIIWPPMPRILEDGFEDIMKHFSYQGYHQVVYCENGPGCCSALVRRHGCSISIKTSFTGCISETTKEKIRKAEKVFGRSNIFLVGDVPKWWWSRGVEKISLVIGIRNNEFWLIDYNV